MISDEDSIFSKNSGDSNYYFKSNNRFFDLMDAIAPEWSSWTISCGSDKDNNLKESLKNGYVGNGNKKKYLFPEKGNIIRFLQGFLRLKADLTSYDFFSNSNLFNIKNITPPVTSLNEKIKSTFQSMVVSETSAKYENKTADLGDNINIEFFVNNDNNVVIKYINDVYDYGIKLFRNYIDKLKETIKDTNELRKNSRVIKMFEIICNSISSETFKFDEDNYHSKIVSKECAASYFSKLSSLGKTIEPKKLKIYGDNINFKKTPEFIEPSWISTNDSDTAEILEDAMKTHKIESPLQFFETEIINKNGSFFDNLDTSLSFYESKIDEYCNAVSGSVTSKISYLLLYDYEKRYDNQPQFQKKYDTRGRVDCSIYAPEFKIINKYQYETNYGVVKINGVEYTNYYDIYKNLSILVYDLLSDLCDITNGVIQNNITIENNQRDSAKFSEYIKSRFASESGYFTEENFFYLRENEKTSKAPVNSFIDVEFRVPQYSNGKWEAVWIPVTAVREYDKIDYDIGVNVDDLKDTTSNEPSIHAGTYFNNMEIEDKGGTKEITLVLKSVNDVNLENIIFYSLAIDQKLYYSDYYYKSEVNIDHVDQIMKDSESNFRVRFGYRDRVPDISSDKKATITTSNEFDEEFINRDKSFNDDNGKKYVMPVQTYPWTYFKITGIQSSINDGEDTYTLTGVSSGSYILKNLSLCGVQPNFAGKNDGGTNDEYRGTPKNVIGKLTNWITKASCGKGGDITQAKIVFLGDDNGDDEEGRIITGFNGKNFEKEYKYVLRSGRIFKGGNLEGIENFFFDSTGSGMLDAKNFSLNNNAKTYSLQEILDNLVEWLPQRVYYIAKQQQGQEYEGQTVAIYVPYEDIYKMDNFFSTQPRKTEKITYQIIESDAFIYKGDKPSNITSDMYHRVYFVRMYFEGPGVKTDNKSSENSYLRVYNYRSVQNQVIENISIDSNNAELGNIISSVTLLGSATPMVFTFDKTKSEINKIIYSQTNGRDFSEDSFKNQQNNERVKDTGISFDTYFNGPTGDNIKPYFVLNNSKYINIEDLKTDNTPTAVSNKLEEASSFFTSQQNKEYTGEMTIMGDPFYYFDSTVEAGKYEIFLQMNRVADRKSYTMVPSRYTGIYYITGIKQAIDENGKYTTTLSIVKRIFGTLGSTDESS